MLERLASFFSSHAAFCAATPEMSQTSLLGKEGDAVRHAMTNRRREFATGSATARVALRRPNVGTYPAKCRPGAGLASALIKGFR
jgi:4'-phosphopantetheinyl transferase EntD